MIVDAAWYLTNQVRDKEIERYSEKYGEQIRTHTNELATYFLNRNSVVKED